MNIKAFFIVIEVIIILFAAMGADGIKVSVIPFPEIGRFKKMSAIVNELRIRSHEVIIYIPESFIEECRKELEYGCVSIGTYNGSFKKIEEIEGSSNLLIKFYSFFSSERCSENFNAFVASSIKGIFKKDKSLPEVMIVDIDTWGADSIAIEFKIPIIFLWSLTYWPVQMNPSIPTLWGYQNIHMNLVERAKNYVFQRLNYWILRIQNIRFDGSYEPFERILYERQIIAPFIFGFDVAQPFCPNVHPVGFLFSPMKNNEIFNSDLLSWANNCKNGIIYVNLRSTTILPNKWINTIARSVEAIIDYSNMCILLNLNKGQNLLFKEQDKEKRLKLTDSISFSSSLLFNHSNTKVFVTQCTDNSVYESINRKVPILGLNIVGDQKDICTKIRNAGVGIVLESHNVNHNQILKSILSMKDNLKFKEKISSIKRMGDVLGGSKRAVDIVENILLLGTSNNAMFCRLTRLSFIERHDLDVTLIISALIAIIFMIIFKKCFRARSKKEIRKKQD